MIIDTERTLDIEGHRLLVWITADFSVDTDPAYGADSDGRRGRSAIDIQTVRIVVEDTRRNDITEALMQRHPSVFRSLIESLEECEVAEALREEDPRG